MFLFYFFIFIIGLAVGSFLNVVIFRLESGEKIVRGRSHCGHCHKDLAWRDLVPVFSFLALRGKCRYCRKPISRQYPLVEIATGLLFILIFNFKFLIFKQFLISNFEFLNIFSVFNFNFFYFLLSTFYFLFIASSLIVIFVYDLKHYIIPDNVIYPAIAISFIYQLTNVLKFIHLDLFENFKFEIKNLMPFFNPFVAAFVAAGFFLAIVLLTRGEGMGGGDVKLAFLMGLILGLDKILIALSAAFSIGAVFGIILIILKKKTLKSAIPFGPFMVIGTIVGLLISFY